MARVENGEIVDVETRGKTEELDNDILPALHECDNNDDSMELNFDDDTKPESN